MKDILVPILIGVALIVAILGLTWIVQGNDFFLYKHFAPKYEAVRRDTFEQSKAFNEGMITELQNMQFEYVKATPEQQKALASIILHRTADYDMSKAPVELQEFVKKLRAARSGSSDGTVAK